MANQLQGKRIAFVVANEGVEQVELTSPWVTVETAGGQPVLVATKKAPVQAFNHLDKGDRFHVDLKTNEADVADFDALVLPGGVANADKIRTDEHAVAFVRSFFDTGRPVAVICHGPWIIVEADRVRGRTLTSWPSLRTDLRNAGATWVNEQVQVDTNGPNTLVSSRKPADLDAFNAKLRSAFASAERRSSAA
jgi:protease I